jgi:hypothetical protein
MLFAGFFRDRKGGVAPLLNVNAASITLYTVQVPAASSTLLKNCAGSAGKYPDANKLFLLTSASAIITTFAQIGSSLSNLRVAK